MAFLAMWIEGPLGLLLRGRLGLGRLLSVTANHDHAEEGADDG